VCVFVWWRGGWGVHARVALNGTHKSRDHGAGETISNQSNFCQVAEWIHENVDQNPHLLTIEGLPHACPHGARRELRHERSVPC
jgi:hypothetical protein